MGRLLVIPRFRHLHSARCSQNWIGTIAGRVGLVEDRWLFYAKLGGGWVHSNASLNFPGVTWHGSNTSSGWLAGVGIEYGFKSHWTIKLEYDLHWAGKLDFAHRPVRSS